MKATGSPDNAYDKQIATTQITNRLYAGPSKPVGDQPRHRSLTPKQDQAVHPRRVWVWILLSAFLLTGLRYQPDTVLHTNPQTAQLKVGETTTVDLALTDVRGLYGAEIHLRFDPKVLKVIDAAPGTDGVQLEPGTLPVPDFVVQNEANNETGTIDYAVTQLPPSEPGEGSGVIARITFQAIKPSVSSLQFEQYLLADTIGGNIDAHPQDGQITIQSRSAWMIYAALGAILTLLVGGIGYLVTRTSVRERK